MTKENKDQWVVDLVEHVRKTGRAPVIGNSMAEFRSPITGEMISRPDQLKDHEKKHDVVQVGSDINYKKELEVLNQQP